jgi:hypothetical protein
MKDVNVKQILDSLEVSQVQDLLENDMETKLSNRISNRIKKSVRSKISGEEVKATKPFRFQLAMNVTAILVLALTTVVMLYALSPDRAIDTLTVATAEVSTVVNKVNPDNKQGWTWVVEPTLGHSTIWHCEVCDVFITQVYDEESDSFIEKALDEKTGLIKDEKNHDFINDCFSSVSVKTWVYDPELDLFGYTYINHSEMGIELQPFNEYKDDGIDYIRFVRIVDSTLRVKNTESVDGESAIGETLAEEAYMAYSKVALFADGKFTSDFMNVKHIPTRPLHTVIAVANSDMNSIDAIGVIDKYGEEVVPFEFETILIIDAWTAFAKKANGNYGIIAFNGYVPPTEEQSPSDFERFIEKLNQTGLKYTMSDRTHDLEEGVRAIKWHTFSIELDGENTSAFSVFEFRSKAKTMGELRRAHGAPWMRGGGDMHFPIWPVICYSDTIIMWYFDENGEFSDLIEEMCECQREHRRFCGSKYPENDIE